MGELIARLSSPTRRTEQPDPEGSKVQGFSCFWHRDDLPSSPKTTGWPAKMPPLPSDPIPAFTNCKGRSRAPLAVLSAIAWGHTRGPLQQLGRKTETGSHICNQRWDELENGHCQEWGGGGANWGFLSPGMHPRKNVLTSVTLAAPSLASPFGKTLLNSPDADLVVEESFWLQAPWWPMSGSPRAVCLRGNRRQIWSLWSGRKRGWEVHRWAVKRVVLS